MLSLQRTLFVVPGVLVPALAIGLLSHFTSGTSHAAARSATAANMGCSNPDADSDGHKSIRCGGDDCDDGDADRFPGNTEVCDSKNHDEDCNGETFGRRDRDGDGHVDATCCNVRNNRLECGDDCNDDRPAIVPGAVVCGKETPWVCSPSGMYKKSHCKGDAVCVWQPNRTGVCAPETSGYQTPPPISQPKRSRAGLKVKPGVRPRPRIPGGHMPTPKLPTK